MSGYPSFSRDLLIMSYTPTRGALAVETTSFFVLMFGRFANKTYLIYCYYYLFIYLFFVNKKYRYIVFPARFRNRFQINARFT